MHSRLENRTIELVKRTQQRINMTLRTHVVSGNTNHPITIDHKSRTNHTLVNLAIQFLLTIRTIQTMHSQISIRQQRERQIIALAESDELVQRILRYAEHGKSAGAQSFEVVSEVAGLGGAARRHRGRVEVEDDGAACEVRERDILAVLIGQREGGRGGTGRQSCSHGGKCIGGGTAGSAGLLA